MTGMDVFRQALRLLNYTDVSGETDAAAAGELYKRGLSVMEQLCAELCLSESGRLPPPLRSLNERLPVSEKTARTVLPYGVAMLLAAGRGDGDNQQLFASLYDQKRASLHTGREQRVNVFPRGCDE